MMATSRSPAPVWKFLRRLLAPYVTRCEQCSGPAYPLRRHSSRVVLDATGNTNRTDVVLCRLCWDALDVDERLAAVRNAAGLPEATGTATEGDT